MRVHLLMSSSGLQRLQAIKGCWILKSTLKKQYFDKNITNAQSKAMHAGRVNDDDWKFLSSYWRSPDCGV